MKIQDILDKPTLTPKALAELHGVSEEQINKELQLGVQVEQEHTSDLAIAKEIALDHLKEYPDYYTRLKTVET